MGIVASLVDSYPALIQAAIREVRHMERNLPKIADGPVSLTPLTPIEAPMAGNLSLSRDVVDIITKAIQEAASVATLAEALEIGYAAFGQVACTEAAKEGISAFMEKRSPRFKS